MNAYEEMLSATSTSYAPWYVLPADDKWFTRLCLGGIIYFEFERLGFDYPVVSDEQKKALQLVKQELLAEDGGGKKKDKDEGKAEKKVKVDAEVRAKAEKKVEVKAEKKVEAKVKLKKG
jgi:hypothetical protein